MCEYCKLLRGDREILEENGETEIAIGRVNKDYYIEAGNDYDSIDIDINYCPFCGRKLSEQNMCADEMFDELGYEKHSSKSHERFDLYSSDDEHLIRIAFNLRTKRIAIYCDNDALDIQELQAINKKVEELGWK